jgi:hypothetical protein
MRLIAFACISALALASAAANAQTMRPGLWDVTTKMGGSPEMDKAMAQMQAQLATMPPAQRKQMEDMMRKQGVGLSGASGGGMNARICVTKEMAERNQVPMQQRGNCTTTTSDKTASSMKMKFTCTNPPSTGDGQFTFSGDTAYTMTMNVSSSIQGRQKTTTIDSSGRWANADCGAVKPIAMPPVAK